MHGLEVCVPVFAEVGACRGKERKQLGGRPGGVRGGTPTQHLGKVRTGALCAHPARVQGAQSRAMRGVPMDWASQPCWLGQVFLFELQGFCGAREKPGGSGTWAQLRQALWLMRENEAGAAGARGRLMGCSQARRFPRARLPLLHGLASPGSGFRGRRYIWAPEGTGLLEMCGETVAKEWSGLASRGAQCQTYRSQIQIPGALAGSAFTSLLFSCFVPGCGGSELGFNFPAPAAAQGLPAGGAKSERWKWVRGC